MHWSPKEIKHYYELVWEQSIDQGIDEYNDKVQQPTYECSEEFASTEKNLGLMNLMKYGK